MPKFRPISISLSPNTEKDDIRLALRWIFRCWKWKKGRAIKELEEEFKRYFGSKYAFSFNSGRSAFLAILKSLNLEPESEVLLQAFTCNAAANPILWLGLKPVYVDCDENAFNIDLEDLERKIALRQAQGSSPRVLMVQHTFGLPAEMDRILEIVRQNNLILIEDCAHSLGASYKGRKIGTFGKAAFFSFSRDKIISSVYGGMAITNDDDLAKALRQNQGEFGYPSFCWIFQQLLHPILTNCLILPTYSICGKYLLVLFQWFRILSKAVHWKEKRGKRPSYFPKKMPNALSQLALNQFRKLERFNSRRKKIAEFYFKSLENSSFKLPKTYPESEQVFLRFTVKHPRASEIIKKAWKRNLLIGDWYTSPVAPDDTKLEKVKYKLRSCPKAERLSKITLNLPTHINIFEDDVERIVNFLEEFK